MVRFRNCVSLHGKYQFPVVIAIVFLSRLPFLTAGCGSDNDAWRIVGAAQRIAEEGTYFASRSPGYPIPEICYSFICQLDPWVTNGVTAVLSAVAVTFFGLSVKKLGSKNYVVASLVLAFTPIVYVESTTSMDYLWALTFVLGGFYFVLHQKPGTAGIFLGFAIGCRITSGAMLLPLSILLFQRMDGKQSIVAIIKMALLSLLVGTVAFLPVFCKYGMGLLTFYEDGYPSLASVLDKAVYLVWGKVGTIALVLIYGNLLFTALFGNRKWAMSQLATRKNIACCLCVIGLYTIAFLRLPHEAGYLIPIVPFVILLTVILSERKTLVFLCVAIIISSFVNISRLGVDYGPILRKHNTRTHRLEFAERVITQARQLPEHSVIICGSYTVFIAVLARDLTESSKCVYNLNKRQLERLVANDKQVYYLPSVKVCDLQHTDANIAKYGIIPLLPEEEGR